MGHYPDGKTTRRGETDQHFQAFDRGSLSVAYVKPFDQLVEGNETWKLAGTLGTEFATGW